MQQLVVGVGWHDGSGYANLAGGGLVLKATPVTAPRETEEE
jgi:hypothetical protein